MDEDEVLGHFSAGYISGEGSFYITLPRTAAGQAQCGFSLKVRADNHELVETIWQALGQVGRLYTAANRRGGTVALLVRSQRDLVNVVIPFFERYPLRGQQRRHYEIWKQAVLLMWENAHLTSEGLSTLAALKAQMKQA